MGMILVMVFVETSIYTKAIDQLLSDDEQLALELSLSLDPKQGAIILGTGGVRKLCFGQATTHKGKRSGIRVIYFYNSGDTIYLLMAYPKNVKDDLTREEKKTLKQLTKTLKER